MSKATHIINRLVNIGALANVNEDLTGTKPILSADDFVTSISMSYPDAIVLSNTGEITEKSIRVAISSLDSDSVILGIYNPESGDGWLVDPDYQAEDTSESGLNEKEVKDFYRDLYAESKRNWRSKKINLGPLEDTISKFSHSGTDTKQIKQWTSEVDAEDTNESIADMIDPADIKPGMNILVTNHGESNRVKVESVTPKDGNKYVFEVTHLSGSSLKEGTKSKMYEEGNGSKYKRIK